MQSPGVDAGEAAEPGREAAAVSESAVVSVG